MFNCLFFCTRRTSEHLNRHISFKAAVLRLKDALIRTFFTQDTRFIHFSSTQEDKKKYQRGVTDSFFRRTQSRPGFYGGNSCTQTKMFTAFRGECQLAITQRVLPHLALPVPSEISKASGDIRIAQYRGQILVKIWAKGTKQISATVNRGPVLIKQVYHEFNSTNEETLSRRHPHFILHLPKLPPSSIQQHKQPAGE